MLDLSMLQYQNQISVIPVPYDCVRTIEHFLREYDIAGYTIVNPKQLSDANLHRLKEEYGIDSIPKTCPIKPSSDDEIIYELPNPVLFISYFDANAVKSALWAIWQSDEYRDYIDAALNRDNKLEKLAKVWHKHPGPCIEYACMTMPYMTTQCADDF